MKAIGCERMDVVAHRAYYKGPEILACANKGITTYLPKPQTSGNQSKGLLGKQDLKYIEKVDKYLCPAGERLTFRYQSFEKGQAIDRYWSSSCADCKLKRQCTSGKERRISRWEHEHVLEEHDKRMIDDSQCMMVRRSIVEHPFGTLKYWIGDTHFLTRKKPNVGTEALMEAIRELTRCFALHFLRATTRILSTSELINTDLTKSPVRGGQFTRPCESPES